MVCEAMVNGTSLCGRSVVIEWLHKQLNEESLMKGHSGAAMATDFEKYNGGHVEYKVGGNGRASRS